MGYGSSKSVAGIKLRDATESVGWLNSEGPLTVAPKFEGSTQNKGESPMSQQVQTPNKEVWLNLSQLRILCEKYDKDYDLPNYPGFAIFEFVREQFEGEQ